MSDTQRFPRRDTGRRLLRCPKCAAEIDSRAPMCEFCGALVYLTGKGYTLAQEGQVCFHCGDMNRWSAEGNHCRGCGRPFATTCPGCGVGVPLHHRACPACGISVEDFDVERARAAVARYREPREVERFSTLYARWQAFVGLLLMLVALIVVRFEPRARRPALALAAAAGCAAFVPYAITRCARPKRRTP
jgi:hypothetical protein